MSLQPDRLRLLHEAKLRALVREHLVVGGDPDAATAALPARPVTGGAALQAGDDLWVYVAGDPDRALGRALVLAARDAPASLQLVLDVDTGHDARRAASLGLPLANFGLPATRAVVQGPNLGPDRPGFGPDRSAVGPDRSAVGPVRVWWVEGTTLAPAVAVALALPADPPSGPVTAGLVAMLRAAGLDVVVEHGVISGEVRGLEVARVKVAPSGVVSLDVGVGRFDQEAGALLHGDQPTEVALDRAVALVRGHRRDGAAPHAVNRLARERWLRAQVVDMPALVDLESLVPVSPPLPRRNVKDAAPASAIGHDADGAVLVLCTVGVDLEWVPIAADLIERERPGRLVVVLPPRDLLPVQHRLAALLGVPVRFVALEGDWPV